MLWLSGCMSRLGSREPTKTQEVSQAEPSMSSTNAHPGETRSYVVKSGDTLSGISRGFGCTVTDLRLLNPGLATSSPPLKVGQTLRVPVAKRGSSATPLPEGTPASIEFPPPGAFENIVQMVWVEPDQEPVVADLYDRFLALLAGGRIEPGAKFPASERFFTATETHAIFHWAYYIAPNEPRGFEISIPKELLRKKDGNYIVTKELEVEQVDQRQFCKIIVMKRASSATPPPGVIRSIGERKP